MFPILSLTLYTWHTKNLSNKETNVGFATAYVMAFSTVTGQFAYYLLLKFFCTSWSLVKIAKKLRYSFFTFQTTTVAIETNGTTGHTLTGIPQIDYIWDPNLPRELNGYNLSDYPFYNSIPEDIDFKCDGLHDGFYASVPHKCQVIKI